MAKRRADTELNHDNWDDEYEKEEAGTFQRASKEALQGRIVKKAKRRVPKQQQDSKNIFTGFSSLANTKIPEADFSFLKKFQTSSNNVTSEAKPTFKSSTPVTQTVSFKNTSTKSSESPKKDSLIETLNQNFLQWIKEHIEKDPCCILTPTFPDYERHLSDIQNKTKNVNVENVPKLSFEQTSSGNNKQAPLFTFGKSENASKLDWNSKKDSESSHKFKFGLSSDEASKNNSNLGKKALETNPPFQIGPFNSGSAINFKFPSSEQKKSSSEDSMGAKKDSSSKFTFGTNDSSGGGSLSFGSADGKKGFGGSGFSGFSFVPPPKKEESNQEDPEDEPPKVEIKQVEEEDAVYSMKCKLFFKKESQYSEKGVGMLYLKETENKKTQLIIRADTNLGNILLNILLQADLPIQRVGKNNVLIVCIPNPPLNPKAPDDTPVPMLIRVKTANDADELLSKLEELKQK